MIFRYVLFFLFGITIQCQEVLNSSIFLVDDIVILPYRRAFTLLESNIVNKLLNINLSNVNDSLSNLANEFHCTVEEIDLNLQQTTLANQMIIRQVGFHVDQLIDSISQLENKTTKTEIFIKELNNTVQNTRENVQLAKIALNTAHRYFSNLVGSMQRFSHRRQGGLFRNNDDDNLFFGKRNGQHRFSHHIGGIGTNSLFDTDIKSTNYQSTLKAIDEAHKNLVNLQHQLKDKIDKYNETQSQLRNISQQLMKLNRTLEEQQNKLLMANVLNKHFQLINNRLKSVSNSSKRLLDVLMYVLDDKAIVEPINSIYEKLFTENIVKSGDLTFSNQVMNNIRHKLILLTVKLPQLRYRQKQFHHSCKYTTSELITYDIDTKTNGNIKSRSRRTLFHINQISKQ